MSSCIGTDSRRSSPVAAKKLFDSSADRNKDPILSVLRQFIRSGSNQNLLEISSGTGQHLAHFAPYFPQVTFYPSEFDLSLLESIAAHTKDFSNVQPPILIDIATDYTIWGDKTFKENSFDYIFNSNMVHISPITCSVGLFKNAGKLLKQNGILFTYGAYMIDGTISPESNVRFDQYLKSQDGNWGLRDIRYLEKLANENEIHLIQMIDMPSNNKTIIWQKK